MELRRRARRGLHNFGCAYLSFGNRNELSFALCGKADTHRYFPQAYVAARVLLRYPSGGRHNFSALLRPRHARRIAFKRCNDGAYKRRYNSRLAGDDAHKRASARARVRRYHSAFFAVYVVAYKKGSAAVQKALFKARRTQRIYRRDYNRSENHQGVSLRRGGNIPL